MKDASFKGFNALSFSEDLFEFQMKFIFNEDFNGFH